MQQIIERRSQEDVLSLLDQFPAVALIGSRQVGKTTLANEISKIRKSVYLDLGKSEDSSKLSDPVPYLETHKDKLVILDEIQFMPELFRELRGLIDRTRMEGKRGGSFLILGSASGELMKQSSESLAGRIAYVDLHPFDVLEIKAETQDNLWIRGGYPDSLLKPFERDSVKWRKNLIKTYLERDFPQIGMQSPTETLRRFWTMLAHSHGQLLNVSQLATNLAVNGRTILRYIDLMIDMFLVRRLAPYHGNTKKRLVRAPKIYLRDSGLVHSLLGLNDREAILGHPIVGSSWEGFVIENILRTISDGCQVLFYRSTVGAEIDLLLELPNLGLWAVEVKRSLAPKLSRGFLHARKDLQPKRSFIIYSGNDRYFIRDDVEVLGLEEFCCELLPNIQPSLSL